jgi:DNA-binding beta-propeller fold protein YncE
MPQYDPVARKVYVNLQDKNIFAVIDASSDEVVAKYPVGKCQGNHGTALGPAHHRAFLSCEGNEMMTVFDLDKHIPIAFFKMPGGPDVIKFDPGLRRIYVACYSGAIAVFRQDDPPRAACGALARRRSENTSSIRVRARRRRETGRTYGGL